MRKLFFISQCKAHDDTTPARVPVLRITIINQRVYITTGHHDHVRHLIIIPTGDIVRRVQKYILGGRDPMRGHCRTSALSPHSIERRRRFVRQTGRHRIERGYRRAGYLHPTTAVQSLIRFVTIQSSKHGLFLCTSGPDGLFSS